jgi:ACDE family multidrug resistance protein
MIPILSSNALLPIVPYLREHLSLSAFEIGMFFSVPQLMSATLGPLLGRLSDRIGRKKVVTVALLVYALGGLVALLSPWLFFGGSAYAVMMIGRVLEGAGDAGIFSQMLAIGAESFEGEERALVLGRMEAISSCAGIAAAPLGGLVAARIWNGGFGVGIIAASVGAISAVLLLKTTAKVRGVAPQPGKSKEKISIPSMLPVMMGGFAVLFALTGTQSFLATLAEDRYGIGAVGRSLLIAIYPGAMAAGSFVAGKVPGLPKRILLASALAAAVVSALGLAAGGPAAVLIVCLILGGLAAGVALPVLNAHTSETTPDGKQGSAMALFNSARLCGGLVAPTVLGAILSRYSYQLAYSVDAVVIFGLGVGSFVVNKRLRRHDASVHTASGA